MDPKAQTQLDFNTFSPIYQFAFLDLKSQKAT